MAKVFTCRSEDFVKAKAEWGEFIKQLDPLFISPKDMFLYGAMMYRLGIEAERSKENVSPGDNF